MKKILITAFEPFGGETINPSYLAIQEIKAIPNVLIKKVCLPVDYDLSGNLILNNIESFNPDIVLMVGQAGGRKTISLERIAVNLDNSMQPDNSGRIRIESKINNDGDDGYFSNLPLIELKKALDHAKIPVSISLSAGTYVCNHIFYLVMHYIKMKPKLKAGFIHVPYIDDQIVNKENTASMKLADIITSLEIIIEQLL